MTIFASRACFLSKWSSLWVRLRCQSEHSSNCPPAWPPAQEGRMWWLDAKWVPRLSLLSDPLCPSSGPRGTSVSATVDPATSSPFANMSLIWLACRTQMSQWREINLRARRCQANDSCGLQFHQMSAVANLQWTWVGHPLDVLYMHSKYFLNTNLIWGVNQNLYVTAHMAEAFK